MFHATDKMPDLIYHLDTEGRIVFINQAVQRYGYDRESLIGEHVLDLVHPEDRERARWKLTERRADPALWLQIIHPDDRKRVEDALVRLNTEHKLDPVEYRIFDEARTYLRELGDSILEIDNTGSSRIQLDYHIDQPIWLPVATVIPLGMIFSELLTNAIKYAFPDGEGGQVWIHLWRHTEYEFELQVCDNGKALPSDFDTKSLSIGHSLITNLARQLNGSFEITDKPDYKCFCIRFAID
ncbi:MAG: PAS domain-containing protein [Spirochaetota bacterium]